MADIDLSKVQAGDTVKFRDGSQSVVEEIRRIDSFDFQWVIEFGEKFVGQYNHNGNFWHFMNKPYLDIIAIAPANVAFDWKDAKWGMAFMDKEHQELRWFVGRNPKLRPEYCVFVDELGNVLVPHLSRLKRWQKEDIANG